jgi:hypothetical protein
VLQSNSVRFVLRVVKEHAEELQRGALLEEFDRDALSDLDQEAVDFVGNQREPFCDWAGETGLQYIDSVFRGRAATGLGIDGRGSEGHNGGEQ